MFTFDQQIIEGFSIREKGLIIQIGCSLQQVHIWERLMITKVRLVDTDIWVCHLLHPIKATQVQVWRRENTFSSNCSNSTLNQETTITIMMMVVNQREARYLNKVRKQNTILTSCFIKIVNYTTDQKPVNPKINSVSFMSLY